MPHPVIDFSTIILASGPAIITGLTSYFIAQNQTQMKKVEVKGECEYKAREIIFKQYQQKLENGRESNKQLHESIANLIFNAPIGNFQERANYFRVIIRFLEFNKESFETYLENTEEEFKKANLMNEKNLVLLKSAREFLSIDWSSANDQQIEGLFLKLYNLLNQFITQENFLLEKKSNELFSKYLC